MNNRGKKRKKPAKMQPGKELGTSFAISMFGPDEHFVVSAYSDQILKPFIIVYIF